MCAQMCARGPRTDASARIARPVRKARTRSRDLASHLPWCNRRAWARTHPEGRVISLAFFEWASSMDGAAVAVTRLALIVVLVWIGALKAAKYEADSIVPLVANSPFMRFFYADRRHYRAHMNPEGALVPANRAW